jgi:hypothetical protein
MKRNNSSKNAADVTLSEPEPPTGDYEKTEPDDPNELIEHLVWRGKATLLHLDAKVAGIEADLAHNFPMVSHKKHLTGAPAKLWGSLSVAPDITTLSVVPDPATGEWRVRCTRLNRSKAGHPLEQIGGKTTIKKLSLKTIQNLSRGREIPRPDFVVITHLHRLAGIKPSTFTQENSAYALGLEIAQWAKDFDIGIVVTLPRTMELCGTLLIPFHRVLQAQPAPGPRSYTILLNENRRPIRVMDLWRAPDTKAFTATPGKCLLSLWDRINNPMF